MNIEVPIFALVLIGWFFGISSYLIISDYLTRRKMRRRNKNLIEKLDKYLDEQDNS